MNSFCSHSGNLFFTYKGILLLELRCKVSEKINSEVQSSFYLSFIMLFAMTTVCKIILSFKQNFTIGLKRVYNMMQKCQKTGILPVCCFFRQNGRWIENGG